MLNLTLKLKRKRLVLGSALVALCVVAAWIIWSTTFPDVFEYGKNGVGPIRLGGYVHTESDLNEVSWGPWGKVGWKGRERSVTEIVMFDGRTVVPFRWSMMSKRPLIIRFTPEKIRIIDLGDISLGSYSRR